MSKSYYTPLISKDIFDAVKNDCAEKITKNDCISHIEKYTEIDSFSCCYVEIRFEETEELFCLPNDDGGRAVDEELKDFTTITCYEDYFNLTNNVTNDETNNEIEDSSISIKYSLLTSLCLILFLI